MKRTKGLGNLGLSQRRCLRLQKLALEISSQTKADVFTRFSPHINEFQMDIYYDGWSGAVYPDVSIEFDDPFRCGIFYPQRSIYVPECTSVSKAIKCLEAMRDKLSGEATPVRRH